jgi:hypothetical protein
VKGAEVIDATDPEHSGLQGRFFPSEATSAPSERSETATKCSVQPFDERGVDPGSSSCRFHSPALDSTHGGNDLLLRSLEHPMNDALDPLLLILLHVIRLHDLTHQESLFQFTT